MTRNIVVSLVIALLAVITGVWLAKNTHWEDVEVHTPSKGEAATNPFYSLQHLSEALGAHTQVRHEIVNLPSPGGVIVLSFWNWNIIPERRQRLEQWVKAGGRLVVGSNEVSDETFVDWSGVKEMPAPRRGEETPRKTTPRNDSLTCGSLTRRLTSATDSTEHYSPCGYELAHGLLTTRKVTWRLLDRDGHTQAVRIPIGKGSVTVLNAVNPGNDDVLCGEYAPLFVAATQLRRGDPVDFLTEGDGGSLLGLIWQYGAPVVVLGAVLIALWLWRSGVRFGPLVAATQTARRSLAEQIRGTGQFTLRFGGGAALYAAGVRALNEVANRHIVHYERLDADARVAALAALTQLQPADLTRALYDKDRVKPQEIRRTIAFLEAARRRLLAATEMTRAR